LRASAARAGVSDRVRFLGQRSDVPRLMAAADVYCQPNTGAEPFGIVFVEALYAGLPVVASAAGGALEIVDETCGVLTPVGDPAAVADTLRELLTDPTRRRNLGTNGPMRAAALCDPGRYLARLADQVREVAG
jgi:glycosyltransferase involved in cell wall biosynthesis